MIEIIQNTAIPFISSIAGIIFTAYIAILIKHSSSKKEAIKSIKSVLISIFIMLILLANIYFLYHIVSSEEPITRLDILAISLSVVNLALILLAIIMFKLLLLIENIWGKTHDGK